MAKKDTPKVRWKKPGRPRNADRAKRDAADRKLRKEFARAYVHNDFNAYTAYEVAYGKKPPADYADLLQHADVRPIIEQAERRMREKMAKEVDTIATSRTKLLGELAVIAHSDLADFAPVMTAADPWDAFSKLAPVKRRAVKELSARRVTRHHGHDRDVVEARTIKLHDKLNAIAQIARMEGWDAPDPGSGETPSADTEKRAKTRAALFRALQDLAKPAPIIEVEADDSTIMPPPARER
jgi:hypothetical protein